MLAVYVIESYLIHWGKIIMDNYYNTLDQEILETVYYYHNSIDNVELYTIGCELSEWDGERIVETLKSSCKDNIVVFNTCAVTERAQKASEILIKLLYELYSDRKIYITGCGVDYNYEYYQKYGTCLKNESKFDCKSYNETYKHKLDDSFEHHRHNGNCGLVKIQDGCHNHCTYCVINKLRKTPYSISYSDIKNQISTLLKQGRNEISLLGTEICFYNSDGMKISNLVDKILTDFPDIKCLGLGAIDPASREVEKLIDLYEKYPQQLDNVFTLSAQSACDEILRSMKRRHNVKRLEELVNYAKQKKVYFAWHIIPGFPGETEELFKVTVNNLKRFKPVYIHSMAFSARKGTPAYDMPNQVDYDTIKYREQYLVDLMEEFRHSYDYPTLKSQIQVGQEDVYIARMNFQPEKYGYRIPLDIYDNPSIVKLINSDALKNNDTNYDTVIEYQYNREIDDDILETHAKFLTFNYGVKLLGKIEIDDDMSDRIINGKFNIVNFVVTKSSFIEFYVGNINDIGKFVKCLMKLKRYTNIRDIIDTIQDKNLYHTVISLIGEI